MPKLICAFLVVVAALCQTAAGQDKAALTQLLRSEQSAAEVITELSAYDAKSPWRSEVTWSLAQKLAVKGLNAKDITRTIIGSGEMAAALDGNNDLFAAIALLSGGLMKEPQPGPTLYALERLGVPAFDLLSEVLGQTASDVRDLANEERLRSAPVSALLTHMYIKRYGGMSEKLANRLRDGS